MLFFVGRFRDNDASVDLVSGVQEQRRAAVDASDGGGTHPRAGGQRLRFII